MSIINITNKSLTLVSLTLIDCNCNYLLSKDNPKIKNTKFILDINIFFFYNHTNKNHIFIQLLDILKL